MTRRVQGDYRTRHTLLRRTSTGWSSQDITVPETQYGQSVGVTTLLVRGASILAIYDDYRQSDQDPMYASDASRLVSRSSA